MKIKLQGSQVNSLATASNVGFQKEGATVIGTITIPSKGIEYIEKMPAQTLQGGAGLLAVSIAKTS